MTPEAYEKQRADLVAWADAEFRALCVANKYEQHGPMWKVCLRASKKSATFYTVIRMVPDLPPILVPSFNVGGFRRFWWVVMRAEFLVEGTQPNDQFAVQTRAYCIEDEEKNKLDDARPDDIVRYYVRYGRPVQLDNTVTYSGDPAAHRAMGHLT